MMMNRQAMTSCSDLSSDKPVTFTHRPSHFRANKITKHRALVASWNRIGHSQRVYTPINLT